MPLLPTFHLCFIHMYTLSSSPCQGIHEPARPQPTEDGWRGEGSRQPLFRHLYHHRWRLSRLWDKDIYMWQVVDDQPIPIPKPPRLFNDTLIRIEDTTTTTTPSVSLPPFEFLCMPLDTGCSSEQGFGTGWSLHGFGCYKYITAPTLTNSGSSSDRIDWSQLAPAPKPCLRVVASFISGLFRSTWLIIL